MLKDAFSALGALKASFRAANALKASFMILEAANSPRLGQPPIRTGGGLTKRRARLRVAEASRPPSNRVVEMPSRSAEQRVAAGRPAVVALVPKAVSDPANGGRGRYTTLLGPRNQLSTGS
ncbi:hypothetical protein GCM10023192_48780 [Amycolatopsis samaneae]